MSAPFAADTLQGPKVDWFALSPASKPSKVQYIGPPPA